MFCALILADPLLKKYFQAYVIKEGMAMFAAAQGRLLDDEMKFFHLGPGFEKTTRQRPAALCDALSCAVPKTANMPAQLWQERH